MSLTAIWGHRGALHFAPENTLTAFQMAADMGADGVELDIQLTKDGEIVVIHDETIDRVSDGCGYVRDYKLAELKRFNFNKRGITPPAFMEIPTLAEVLELLKPTRLSINIELKTSVIFYENIERDALALVERAGMSDRVIWSSFNHYSVACVRAFDPGANTALLSSGVIVTGEQCEKTGTRALHLSINHLRCPGLMEDCRARGVAVRPWTVDEPADLRFAAEAGVDAVITNRIDLAKEWVGGR